MAVVFVLTIFFLLVLVLNYHWKRRHLYKLANSLPGPPALPIIGNTLAFLCKPEDIMDVMRDIHADYLAPVRFWFGPKLIVFFDHPEHIKEILSSSKISHKHDLYDFLKIYLGDGLVSASGEKYKKHRKLIAPLLNKKFAVDHMSTFQKHINIFIKKLESYCESGTFDVDLLIEHCFADIVGESILGVQLNAQEGKNVDFLRAVSQMLPACHLRFMKPWLHPDIIFNRTKYKLDQDRITSITYNYFKKVVDKAFERVNSQTMKAQQTTPIIDQVANLIVQDPSVMNNEDFIYHMCTQYVANEDPVTVISSMFIVCLGMYPEYQQQVVDELKCVIGAANSSITYEHLFKLPYLDRCFKDVVRLFPIGGILVRKVTQSLQIGSINLPKDCGVMLSPFTLHRDPEHWENPDHFYPDHFLPEAVKKRHPFAYIPFSFGSRSCVGQILANAQVKLFVVNVLRKYEIEADGKVPDIALKCDITVRPRTRCNIRIKKRNFN